MFELFESRGLMRFKYSIFDFRSTDTHMQGSMHAARVAPHLDWRATHQLNPPRGRSAGEASSLGSTVEPDELPRQKRRPRSPPQLCVGRRTSAEALRRPAMISLFSDPGKVRALEAKCYRGGVTLSLYNFGSTSCALQESLENQLATGHILLLLGQWRLWSRKDSPGASVATARHDLWGSLFMNDSQSKPLSDSQSD